VAGLVLAACGSGGDDEAVDIQSADVTIEPTGSPTPGGKVKYALEGESDGFNPAVNRWAISGLMVANAVFDPLAAFDADGNAQPYLAESFTPSADFLTWTVTMRPGITFHNGEPLDGAAVKTSLDAARESLLAGGALRNIADTAPDPSNPLALVVTMAEPWANFPASLTQQVGMVMAPAQVDAPEPDNTRVPIGTGPFVFKEWVPDKGWIGTKNPNYWRTDSEGTKLPYLDEVEFIPVPDSQNRGTALITGDVQMAHTTNWPTIATLKAEADAGKVQFVADVGENEESFVVLNTAKPPFDDVRVRRALALCTDHASYLAVNEIPAEFQADSQFREGSRWYNPDNGYPSFDAAAGTALVAEVEAERGPLTFTLGTTTDVANQLSTQTLKTQWDACGMDVSLTSTEQGSFVGDMVLGNYEANLSRQFGEADPDADYVWWTGQNAPPLPGLALNMARLSDPQVQAALDAGRASSDPATREQAYDDLQRRQSELIPYIWLNHSQWAIGAANDVRNLTNQTLPDGQPSLPFGRGVHRLTETWLQQ
jgi:ABC-type transport system substrate-binding protein